MLPLFHIMGVNFHIGVPMTSGGIAVMFKPFGPPTIPTPENFLAAVQRSVADHVLTVPSFCAQWAEDKKSIEILKGIKCLAFGGGPLAEEKGDILVKNGVNLLLTYGLTEGGSLFKVTYKSTPRKAGWNFSTIAPDVKYRMVLDSHGLFRLIILDSETHGIALCNIESEDAYDTLNLFEEHPEFKGYWKVVGRADDQITMANGEKTNPGPLEDIILGNHHVRAALMFGRSRDQVGSIVQPAKPFDIADDAEVSRFRNLIWPEVDRANAVQVPLLHIQPIPTSQNIGGAPYEVYGDVWAYHAQWREL